jgi:hypothetical protein
LITEFGYERCAMAVMALAVMALAVIAAVAGGDDPLLLKT